MAAWCACRGERVPPRRAAARSGDRSESAPDESGVAAGSRSSRSRTASISCSTRSSLSSVRASWRASRITSRRPASRRLRSSQVQRVARQLRQRCGVLGQLTEQRRESAGADEAFGRLGGLGLGLLVEPSRPARRAVGASRSAAIWLPRYADALVRNLPAAARTTAFVQSTRSVWYLTALQCRQAMSELDGRAALVTGGGSGIGRAVAQRLIDDGHGRAQRRRRHAGGRARLDVRGRSHHADGQPRRRSRRRSTGSAGSTSSSPMQASSTSRRCASSTRIAGRR